MLCLRKIILKDECVVWQRLSRCIPILLLSAIAVPSIYGGESEKLKITGNLRNRVLYSHVREDSALNPDNILNIPKVGNNSRLELFLDSKASEWTKAHFSGRSYYSTLKPEKEFRSFLDEAYFDMNFDNRLNLRIGKQRTVWGAGAAWNPSDILNPVKDPTDPSEQKEGILSAKADFTLGNEWGFLQNPVFTAVFVPSLVGADVFETNRNQLAAKLYFLAGGFDLHLIASFIEDEKPEFGLSASGVLFDVLELHAEGIFQEGSERFYVTSNNQVSQNKLDRGNIFSKWLIGSRYTLPGDIVFLTEYYHTDEGYNRNEIENYLNLLSKDRTKLSLLPQRDLRKNYIFVNLSKSNLWDTFNISSRVLGNLDDGSLMLSPRIEYIRIEDVTLAIEPFFFWGNRKSEFGNASTARSIRLEVSLYF